MMKSGKKFWSYESAQTIDLKQEILDNYKPKGRIFEDINILFDLIGVGIHPSLKQPYGKEHTEPSVLSFQSTLIDINTLKILFQILPTTKVVTLKFCSNFLDASNLDYIITSILMKPNNIFSFILEWNNKIKIEGELYNLNEIPDSINLKDVHLDHYIIEEILKSGQIISKLATSQRLEALCLRGSLIGDETANLLFENLKHNQTLKILNLYKNGLTSKSMQGFNSMIEINKKLEEINLGANLLKDEDLESFKHFIGKTPMSSESVENHSKKNKEKEAILEKNKKLKAQKKHEEPVPFVEDITLIGEVYYIVKNCYLKNFNVMQNLFTENCFDTVINILEGNVDLFITIDGKIFPKLLKDKLNDPSGKYANRIYLIK